MGGDDPDTALHQALASSQRLGMLGDRPVGAVIDHAEAFVAALEDVAGVVIDLGSGGGVPGLVLAWRRPDLRVVLVDRRATRTDHLRRLVGRLELGHRVQVATADAVAPGPEGLTPIPADAVVARGFGPPAHTATVAARLVRVGGLIVVSEPPGDDHGRWPRDLLDERGLRRRPWPDRRVAVLQRVSRET